MIAVLVLLAALIVFWAGAMAVINGRVFADKPDYEDVMDAYGLVDAREWLARDRGGAVPASRPAAPLVADAAPPCGVGEAGASPQPGVSP